MAKGTKRGRKAAALRGGGERFELAMRAINEGVYDWDVANGTIYYSEAVYSVLHMPRSVKTPGGWRKRIHPDDLAAYDAAIVAHFKKKTRRFECDYRYRARDRTWRWARQHGMAIRDKRGRVVRVIGSTGDITELKRVELALAESRERYALATWAATEGIYEWNLLTDSLFLSDRAKTFFGVKGTRLTPAAWNARVHREDFPGYRAALAAYFKGRTPQFEHEYRIRNTAGGYSWVIDRAAAVRDAKRRVVRLVGAIADVTQRKLAELELRRARDEANEALERQTATAEILRIIGSSITDAQPVFDGIVKNCARLFKDGRIQLRILEDGILRPKASVGKGTDAPVPVDRDSGAGACVMEGRLVHLPDLAAAAKTYPSVRQLGMKHGYRSGIYSPLMRGGRAIGTISVLRHEQGAFSDKEVALLATFADQAVIAIENVRLFNETKEALEQQKATADVLASISGSMTDTQPVFERIVQNLRRLFGTRFAVLQLLHGDTVDMVAVDGHGIEKLRERYPRPLDETTIGGRAMITKEAVQYAPVIDNPEAPQATIEFARDFGFNSVIFSPMIHEGKVIGAIGAAHSDPGPFDERQIALIRTFADQAVIAIENVRLFNETKEALEKQTATADILQVLSGSPSDTQPVFDAIVRHAARLCESTYANVFRYDGERIHLAASQGGSPEALVALRDSYPALPNRKRVVGRVIETGNPVRVEDTLADADYDQGFAGTLKLRRLLGVPLLRAGRAVGAITVGWAEPGPVRPRHEDLLKTFADQAVIAIENVRLFNETKEALDRQTATAEILKVISQSTTDVQPVLEAIVGAAAKLFPQCNAFAFMRDGGLVRLRAMDGATVDDRLREDLGRVYPVPFDPEVSTSARAMAERRPNACADTEAPDVPEHIRRAGRAARFRSNTVVPLVRDDEGIGSIVLTDPEPGHTLDNKQLALLQTFADQAVIAIENVRLFNETREALEQQTATAEILQVISSSPTDTQPVFEAIVQAGLRLFPEATVLMAIPGGAQVRAVAVANRDLARAKATWDRFPIALSRDRLHGAAILDGELIDFPDVEAETEGRFAPGARNFLASGQRAITIAPMMCGDAAIGAISVSRTKTGALGEKQVALLRTFAAQAVIAIENVRLFKELEARNRDVTDALERQTATAEILQVIGSSPTDTQPVFDAIVNSGVRLFPGAMITVARPDGGTVRAAAIAHEDTTMVAGWKERFTTPLSRDRLHAAAILDAKLIDFPDAEAEKDGPLGPGVRNFLLSGNRAVTIMPMLRGEGAIGAISVTRALPGSLSDKQIAILRTFADQAVIAIENVRLFNETKEALERQTATAEILKVIASSPADVQPVFDAIVETAKRLIGAFSATVTHVGDGMLHLVAHTATTPEGAEALNRYFPIPVEGTSMGRAILLRRPEFIDDFEADTDDARDGRELARSRGFKSVVFVPLMRGGGAIGSLNVTRREAGRMADHQIDLLKTFADQAVIAIENVRLFNETKEALERQTATAEVLRVIASSPSDVQPVFDAIAESAKRLFDGQAAVVTRVAGDMLHIAALTSTSEAGNEAVRSLFPRPLSGPNLNSIVARTGAPVFRTDMENDPDAPPEFKEMARKRGYRSILGVPMLREGIAVGTISVTRSEPGNFSDHQINLLRTFADQAVIAIENARLFNETKEALERQTATAEILKVIAGSPTDVQPVFDAIAGSANRLIGGFSTAVARIVGDALHLVAYTSTDEIGDDALKSLYPIPLTRSGIATKVILTKAPVSVSDTETDPEVRPALREVARARGYRSLLMVPLLQDDVAIGAISVTRRESGDFNSHQIDLLKTFADQAVIAIQNVRLFNETRASLERQTATAEILKVISDSPTDVQPALDAIVKSAMRLFEPWRSVVLMRRGNMVELSAVPEIGLAQSDMAELRKIFPAPYDPGKLMVARAIEERRLIEVPDTESPPEQFPLITKTARAARYRSVAFVPLIREGEGIGVIVLTHPTPGSRLTENQLSLVQTFANQAVIAIENVRLFNETKDALERQTATAEILNVISSSPTDVQPVLERVAQRAVELCEGGSAAVYLRHGDVLKQVSVHGDLVYQGTGIVVPLDPSSLSGRAVLEGRTIHVDDVAKVQDQYPTTWAMLKKYAAASGIPLSHSTLTVPLLKDGVGIGHIFVRRGEVRPFSDKQIALLESFAAQSVIAIENVRLFNETKEALERQTATAEILQVISSSPTDAQPVFDAIVRSGMALFSGAGVGIGTVNGDEVVVQAAVGMGGAGKGFRMPLSRESASGLAILERKVVNIRDTEAPDAPLHARENGRRLSIRSMTQAPMFREGEPIGSIGVMLKEPGGLDEKQLALLKTFADQAVIAIENVRLFKELESRTEALTKSVGQLTALGEVGQAISSSLDLETVLQTIVSRAVQLTGMDAGSIYEYDERGEVYRLQAAEKMEPELVEAVRQTPIRKGDGATGRTAVTLEPVQVADIEDKSYQGSRKDNLRRTGYRAVLAVPLLREDILLGALQVFRKSPGPFAPEVVELLKTFATQSAMAIQNARLFREIAEKGKQLEVASRHKSDFLASMSHELRTPLNAILGFNEMILGQIYGEVPKDMQEPLEDIQKSGKHLLRLINNVLDLAKIEAGRMELALSDYSVHDTVESVRATLRPLAAEKGLEFAVSVPQDLPLAYGDSGRITQCLMNLAGNSLKFTKAGRVEIAVTEKDGLLTYRVTDTGVGIPTEKIGSLFTEFRQTDATIASEYGGTGLGLSISKKFVEMHGGRIWIESELGKGSAFIFEIPLRVNS